MSQQKPSPQARRGRGATENPPNRFEPIEYTHDEIEESDERVIKTRYYKDASKSIIVYNNSPDVPFDAGINPYRGCEHGCVYCFARPTHEYFGLSSGIDFESMIFVKENAAQLLRKELTALKWKPQPIGFSGNTDAYQPIERKLKITRECLKVLAEFRNPAGMITKNQLITRDIDILQEMAEFDCVSVMISVTTLDRELARRMEPRTSSPQRRLETIRKLRDAGIPVGALIAPIIPGLTDHEIPQIIKSVADAGAENAYYVMLRLPYAVKDLFSNWLEEHYPDKKSKVLNRIMDMRDGKLNQTGFGERMRGEGPFAQQIQQLFSTAVRRAGLNEGRLKLTTEHFRRPQDRQMEMF